MSSPEGKLFILFGPSGSGKTTLACQLIERWGNDLTIEKVITYTSRAPRVTDQPNKDYYFVSPEEFEQKIREDFFLEWSNAYGHYYGTPRTILSAMGCGRSFLLIIDRQGVESLKRIIPQAFIIFIKTTTFEILQERLFLRNTEKKEEINRRLLKAQEEVELESKNELCDHILINDNLERSLSELVFVIKSALKK